MPEIKNAKAANARVAEEALKKATEALAIATDALGRVLGPDAHVCVELDNARDRVHELRVQGVRDAEETARRSSIEPGTVVEGTMRTEDLIRGFARWLAHLDRFGARAVKAYYCNVFDYMRDHAGELHGASASLLDAAEHCRAELYDRLGEFAPEGMYFGAHPDDGANFGYWPIDSDALDYYHDQYTS